MTKSILIFTPSPDTASFEGRWREVFSAYEQILIAHGFKVCALPLGSPMTEKTDACLPLMAWGYHHAPDRLKKSLTQAQECGAKILNPLELVLWNIEKTYLHDLADQGVRIIPTIFSQNIDAETLTQAHHDFDGPIVVKPSISAGAKNTFVWHLGDQIASFSPSHALWMIQPLMTSVMSEGEWSRIFLGGAFSHCVLKTPKQGDFRSQPDYDSYVRAVDPPKFALELAKACLDLLANKDLLYARIDMVRGQDDEFYLMELELIEPDLYFSHKPEAGAVFALSLLHYLTHS